MRHLWFVGGSQDADIGDLLDINQGSGDQPGTFLNVLSIPAVDVQLSERQNKRGLFLCRHPNFNAESIIGV